MLHTVMLEAFWCDVNLSCNIVQMLVLIWYLNRDLATINICYVQAKEDEDKPGLEAMLQKVLQLYASRVLSKRSYAKKGTCCF